MDIDSWLKHKTQASNGQFLRNWTESGSCEIYLHQYTGLDPIWSNNWYKVKTYQSKKTGEDVTAVFRERYVSHDPERVNIKARHTNEDGTREHPPLVDPMAFMLEWIAEQIATNKISWVEPIFEFKGDDPAKDVVLHAGGMLNLYGGDKFTKQQLREMSDARINRREAWREDARVKCAYLFQVVDCADVSAGVVIALEKTTTTGDRMKKEIEKKMKEYGKDKGNPCKNPYKIVFTFDSTAKNWGEKYGVETRFLEPPPKDILALISDRESLLDTSRVSTPYDLVAFRTEIEHHALVKMPFDDFFEPARRAGLMKQAASSDGARAETRPSPRTPEVSTKPEPAKRGGPVENKYDEPEEGGPCDFCGEILAANDLECGRCGATYEDDGANVRLAGLKCKKCDEVVVLDDETRRTFACASCGAEHELSDALADFYDAQEQAKQDGADAPVLGWELVKKPEPKAEATKTRGGRRRASGGASAAAKGNGKDPAIDAALEGDDIPFARD